jgi:hypothetical protein
VIPDTTAPIIVSLLAVGMALAFILADRFSPTSQAQAVFLAFVGISIAVDVLWVLPMRRTEGVVSWEGLLAIPQVLAFAFAYEWVLRVRQTIPTRDLNTRGPDRLLRAAQGLAAFYGLTAVVFPELSAPILAAAVILPAHIAPVCGAVGLLVLLVGSVQYHVTQGQRAQFLSRFLSPQVGQNSSRGAA